MKKIVLYITASLLLLAGILIIRTILLPSRQITVSPSQHHAPLKGFIGRISKAIQFQTISYDDRPSDTAVFYSFEKFLERNYPLVHRHLEKEKIGSSNLVFLWKGSDLNLLPMMLLAHQDVVPAESKNWKWDPFKGIHDTTFVYGRGTIDDKGSLLGILEATELLLSKGYKPKRSVYLTFGQDEERGGKSGKRLIAETFKKRKIFLEFLLDEGGVIITGAAPGISQPLAVVGIAEKGYISLEITAKSEAGHTSMPPKEVAITKLSDAIVRINDNPFPTKLTGATRQLFNYTGPEMSFLLKVVFANQWLFAPIVKKILERTPSTNATIKTTTAFTILKAGNKENVLPNTATAIVNLRILPGETTKGAIARIHDIINDSSVVIKLLPFFSEPSPVSDPNSESFFLINKTIRQVFPDCIVAPYLVVAATDSRYFTTATNNIYRFFPARLLKEELKMIHGTNEKISIKNYKEVINFYRQLIINGSSPK